MGEMEEKIKDICMREKESSEMIRQRDAKIEEQVEAMNTLKNQNTSLKNEISDMGVDLESTRAGLRKEKLKNEMKDSTIEKLNEKMRMITEEKMEMKIETDKNIADLELSKKVAEEELLSEQEGVEEAMSVQEQQHLSSTEASKELLESMEVKFNARE